jgi:hypothetical protein
MNQYEIKIRQKAHIFTYLLERHTYNIGQHVKGTAIPIQAWTDPEGSRRLRLPEFLDNWHMKVARLSALCTGRLYAPRDTRGTHFF